MKRENILVLFAVMAALILVPAVFAATASTSTTITNAVPVASSTSLNGAGDITLTTNTTTSILGTATITDNNGCDDVTGVTATLFRTNITSGSGASNNNQTHYSATCVNNSDCSGGADLTVTYNCTFSMEHFTDPTDAGSSYADTNWTFNVTPTDGSGGTSDSTVQEVNTLTSMSLDTSSIAFGAIPLGGNTTTTNKNTTIANHGNEGLDVSLTGYGASSDDNLSMDCTTGDINIAYLEYSGSTFTYGSGTDLSNTTTELDLDVVQGNDTTQRPTQPIFYGFGLPTTGVGGSCTGTVVITAVSDSGLD